MLSYFRDREWLVHDAFCSGLSLEKGPSGPVQKCLENARPGGAPVAQREAGSDTARYHGHEKEG
jgi:hypothetical protein